MIFFVFMLPVFRRGENGLDLEYRKVTIIIINKYTIN